MHFYHFGLVSVPFLRSNMTVCHSPKVYKHLVLSSYVNMYVGDATFPFMISRRWCFGTRNFNSLAVSLP